MAEYESVRVANEGGVARITLAREPLNILNIAMMEEICAALESLKGNSGLKVVVFDAVGNNMPIEADATR